MTSSRGPTDPPLDSANVGDWFPSRLKQSPVTVQVWGASRVAVNRTAWELARRVSSRYLWLEVGDPDSPLEPGDPGRTGLVPADQLLEAAPPEEFRPDDESANMALWAVARDGETIDSVGELLAFLRLPRKIQAELQRWKGRDIPSAFVLANVDRVLRFYPENRESTRHALEAFRRQGITLVTTLTGRPKSDRVEYDLLFEVRTPAGTPWDDSTVVCERSLPGMWREPELPVARLIADQGGS